MLSICSPAGGTNIFICTNKSRAVNHQGAGAGRSIKFTWHFLSALDQVIDKRSDKQILKKVQKHLSKFKCQLLLIHTLEKRGVTIKEKNKDKLKINI